MNTWFGSLQLAFWEEIWKLAYFYYQTADYNSFLSEMWLDVYNFAGWHWKVRIDCEMIILSSAMFKEAILYKISAHRWKLQIWLSYFMVLGGLPVDCTKATLLDRVWHWIRMTADLVHLWDFSTRCHTWKDSKNVINIQIFKFLFAEMGDK